MINLAVLSAINPKRQVAVVPFEEPRSAAEIAIAHFAPDDADEWLPRGARTDRNRLVDRRVVAGPGSIATDYTQQQGLLACQVQTNRASYIDLPHFHFPVGWTARLDGRQLLIEPTRDGLIRIRLPADVAGNLTVRFSATPMRKLGIGVTVMSLLVTVGVAGLAPRRFSWMTNRNVV